MNGPTWILRGAVIASVGFVIIIAMLAALIWSTMANRLMIDENRRIIRLIDARAADRWTGKDMKLWVDEMRRLNPGIKVPETP